MSIAEIKSPDEIVCTMQFTMKLGEWKQIKKTLSSNAAYTELKIMREITDLICQLEKTLYANTDDLPAQSIP